MLAFTPSLAVTLAALALAALVGAAAPLRAAGSVAVADLSSTPQPALAEALRKGPGVKGRALPAAQTAAVVEDAKDLGLSCKVSDDACLEKLHVLLRTDELLAFSLERGTIKLARVVTGKPVARAKVKFAAPATSARAVLLALDSAASDRDGADVERDVATVAEAKDTPQTTKDVTSSSAPPRNTTAQRGDVALTPDENGGFSPMLIVGVVGGVVTAGCAAGALGTSAHLASLEASGSIVGTDHSQAEAAFTALSICAAAAVVATGVGFGLFALEDDAPPTTDAELGSSPSE